MYVDLIKHVYTPKRLRGSNISYEDVRALSIAKNEATNTKSGLRRQIRENGYHPNQQLRESLT